MLERGKNDTMVIAASVQSLLNHISKLIEWISCVVDGILPVFTLCLWILSDKEVRTERIFGV